MYIVFGLLVLLGIWVLEYFGYNTFNFVMFNVLPAGAFVVSFGIFVAMFQGLKMANKKYKKLYGVIACIIAVTTYIGVEFIDYKTTFVDEGFADIQGQSSEKEDNMNWVGDLSYVNADGEEVKLTFINYIKFKLDNSDMSLEDKFGNEEIVETNGVLNYIWLFANLLTLAALTPLMLWKAIDIQPVCNMCDSYFFEKHIYKFYGNDYEEEVRELKRRLEFSDSIKQFIKKSNGFRGTRKINRVYLRYCKGCRMGEIRVYRQTSYKETQGRLLESFEVDTVLLKDALQ